jgi:hypothetical protein
MERTRVPVHSVWRAVAIVVGLVLAILGHFALDDLEDVSEIWHVAESATVFLGGVCVGAATVLGWTASRRRA